MSYSNCYKASAIGNNNLGAIPLSFVYNEVYNNASIVSIITEPVIMSQGIWLLTGSVYINASVDKIRKIRTSVTLNDVEKVSASTDNIIAFAGSTPISVVIETNAGDVLDVKCLTFTTDTLGWYIENDTATVLNLIKLA